MHRRRHSGRDAGAGWDGGMKQRPILFSGPMVRALLDGSKTQTRRVAKAKHLSWIEGSVLNFLDGKWNQRPLPYGKPGDQLWVRETWQGPLLEEYEVDADADWQSANRIHQYQNPAHCAFAADGGSPPEFIDSDDNIQRRWRPSIHMPRWASRITLEITGVRVERLQNISEADALAEGVSDTGAKILDSVANEVTGPIAEYSVLWESINGPGSWDLNPWVWVVEFKRIA